jgi:hypothetical protein
MGTPWGDFIANCLHHFPCHFLFLT